MKESLRESGIDVIGRVPWSTHFCLFYQTRQDLVDMLVPYFKAGLESNEFCMWVTSEPLDVKEAAKALKKALPDLDRYLERGQVEILPYTEWYLGGGIFDSQRVLHGWVDKLNNALAMGYRGLRLSGNTFWLEREHWKDFAQYEAEINSTIDNYKMIAMCTYSLDRCNASEIIDVVSNHEFALIKRENQWELIESSEYTKTKEELAWLGSFPELNPSPVMEIDLDGTVTYANLAARKLFPGIMQHKSSQYPWLFDPGGIIAELKAGSKASRFKEIKAGDAWYQLAIYFFPERQCVRVYGSEITERKLAEEELRASEESVRLKLESILSPEGAIGHLELADIIDTRAIQSLFEDFYKLARIPVSIIDLKGKVLVGVGWQDICVRFHRVNPEACRHCIESDTQLSSGVAPGDFKLYKCKNNMWDIASPILVGSQHLGNLFSGQFFFDDELIDYELFRSQAKRYGFREEEYIAALERVPRLSRDTVDTGMAYFLKLSNMLSQLSYTNIRLARALTERGVLMDELRRARDELEIRVRERTARLQMTNKALTEYAAQLESLNEELQEFVFVASHDLQEPLRKIQTFGHMLSSKFESALGTQGQDYLMRITRAAKRMSELLQSLLNYSRVTTRNNPFEPADLTRLVRDAVSDMELVIQKANGSVEIGELPTADVDAAQIRQLFQNLIANSMKYCRECEAPKVNVYAASAGGMYQIFVQDNGMGFQEQYVGRIFRPFQRLHGRSEYEGTGMGLAICRKIAERHGGNITARSIPGRGSTFIVTLPVKHRESGTSDYSIGHTPLE